MTPEAKVAYVNSQVACMLAELESMKVANRVRELDGGYPAYHEEAFRALCEKYGLHHNAVLEHLAP